MATMTLKTLVQKTVTVGSVKLSTPADRIGQGLVDVVTYPAEVLSSGQFPLPPNPGSEPNPGLRMELSASQMREQMREVAPAAAQAGLTGCPVPGSTAHRRPQSFTTRFLVKWQGLATKRLAAIAKRSTAIGGVRATVADKCRASFHAAPDHHSRIGSDCQSPDRPVDPRTATTETTSTAATRK